MPDHHEPKHHDKPKKPGRGPKEFEIAATLTTAAIHAAGGNAGVHSLDEAADAVERIFTRMLGLVHQAPPNGADASRLAKSV
jgi:hypothetical protein